MNINWKAIIVVFLGILALRIFGIITNIWLLLGLIILITVWGLVAGLLSKYRRPINWAFGILVAIALVTTIGANVWHKHIESRTPMTRSALERAVVSTDLELSKLLNPKALKARIVGANQRQTNEDIVGEMLEFASAVSKLELKKSRTITWKAK